MRSPVYPSGVLADWLTWLAGPADAPIVALLVAIGLVALAGRLVRAGL